MQEHGPHVTSYDSYEEMMQDQERNEEAANAAVLEKQREITWGSYFLRLYGQGQGQIHIFGYVYTPEEIKELEIDAGASIQEVEYYLVVRHNAHARGYRWGNCYSVVTPEGEVGSTHISTSWPITKDEFEAAKNQSWTLPIDLYFRVSEEIREAAIKKRKNDG